MGRETSARKGFFVEEERNFFSVPGVHEGWVSLLMSKALCDASSLQIR